MRHNIEISNSDDTIDSRDVIARIEELESERSDLSDALDEAVEASNTDETSDPEELQQAIDDAKHDLQEWDNDNKAELDALKALAEEAEGYASDWNHGEQLIRESYFTDYAREMLEDCGDVPRDLPHYIEIDWEATARNIKQDYTEVSFDEVTYLIR